MNVNDRITIVTEPIKNDFKCVFFKSNHDNIDWSEMGQDPKKKGK